MRKLAVTFLSAVMVAGLATGIASASKGAKAHQAAIVRCGTLYTPTCAPPGSVFVSRAACAKIGRVITTPITLHAVAGLRSVKVTLRGKTILSKRFRGSPRNASVRVEFVTRGLKAGLFQFNVAVTDVRGRTTRRVGHFSLCKPAPPKFTG